jgi:hypothetical protein
MAVVMPSPEESKRLGDTLAAMIQGTDNPEIRAALQARLAPQPTEPETVPKLRSLTPEPQPVQAEAVPELRTLPPGWGETVGMSAMLPPPAPALDQAMSPFAAVSNFRRKPQEIV